MKLSVHQTTTGYEFDGCVSTVDAGLISKSINFEMRRQLRNKGLVPVDWRFRRVRDGYSVCGTAKTI
jgi:hypothetical protein